VRNVLILVTMISWCGNLEAKIVPRSARSSASPMKYLIRWTVLLGREELERISGRPEVLQKVLDYVNRSIKGSKVEIYRIVPLEDLARSVRPSAQDPKPAHPAGIAIAEAGSVEEVRRMLEHLVEGVSFGGLPVPVQNYLEFENHPHMELGRGE
jgi:hypothetical protein